MNIIRLTTRIYPDKAGPAVYAFQSSNHISDNYFIMFNVACRPDGITDKIKKENPNFVIHYLPVKATRWDAGPLKQLLFLFRFGFYSFKMLLKSILSNPG